MRETLLEILHQAKSPEDLQDAALKLRDAIGVDHLVYHSISKTRPPYAALTYTPEWIDRYLEQDYSRVDPVIHGCFQGFSIIDWKQLDWSAKAAKKFLHEAIDSGVGNQGVSLPVRGPNGQFALFTVNANETDDLWKKFRQERKADLTLLSYYMNEKLLDFDKSPDQQAMKSLSPRETDALSYLACGRSRSQTAESLQISEHTLRVYIEAARAKLGATNTTHAVALAISQGLIIL